MPAGIPLIHADAQLCPQPVKVSAATAVLKLACHLHLLGLGSAAPHWLDPLERTGPAWSLSPRLMPTVVTRPNLSGFRACQTARRSSFEWSRAWLVPSYIDNRTCFGRPALPAALASRDQLPSQMPRSLPTSDILRSARR